MKEWDVIVIWFWFNLNLEFEINSSFGYNSFWFRINQNFKMGSGSRLGFNLNSNLISFDN